MKTCPCAAPLNRADLAKPPAKPLPAQKQDGQRLATPLESKHAKREAAQRAVRYQLGITSYETIG